MAKKKPNPNLTDVSVQPPTTTTDQSNDNNNFQTNTTSNNCGPIVETNTTPKDVIQNNIKNTTNIPIVNKVNKQKSNPLKNRTLFANKTPKKQIIKKASSKLTGNKVVSGGSKKENLNKNKSGGGSGSGGNGGGGGGGTGGYESGSGSGGNGGGGASPGLSQNASPHGKPIEDIIPCVDCKEKDTNLLFNKVTETESGHITEIDDSPGSERLHIMHRSGTNFEILPRGSFTGTIVTDGWLSFYRDLWLHVDGFSNITLDKGVKIVINKDEIKNTKDKNVNLDIKIMGKANVNLHLEGGNLNVKIDKGDINLNMQDGDLNIKTVGNYNHYVDGDYNLQVTGDMHTVIGGDRLEEVTGNKEDFIYEGQYTLDSKGGIKNITEGDIEIEAQGSCKAQIYQDYLLKIMGNEDIYIGKRKSEWIDGATTIKSMQHAHYAEGDYNITSNASQNYYASSMIKIYGNTMLDLNGTLPDFANKKPSNTAAEKLIVEYKKYKNIEKSFNTTSRERDN
jgi:hypothetical protein